MKILDKTEIDARKSKERKKEIDEGHKLAVTVDNLRRIKSEEEENLRKFREQSLIAIKNEISSKNDELSKLTIEVEELAKKRLEAQAPVELTQEWKKLEQSKREVSALKQELFDRETHLIGREALVQKLDAREVELATKEIQSETYLEQTRKTYEKTEDMRRKMEERVANSDKVINERLYEQDTREQQLISRENEIVKQLEIISANKRNLADKESQIIARESTI
jgi:hypothetical protein